MASWTYYVIKMDARELSKNVSFAQEIYEDRTLSEAIQRILNESRVNKEIVTYLKRQPDHFFSSIVIAAIEGDPKFYPVQIADDPRFQIFVDDARLNSSFGVLRFDGTQKYYALDGQHRLAAIKTLLDRDNPLSDGAPENFGSEEFSIMLVVQSETDSIEVFRQKYRRLFANLNRYAKPMDQATNIIMDEDDLFAIITRRLITDHHFFKSAGRQRDSIRVKTSKGKNLKSSDAFFTSIETLYEMNIELLSSRSRENHGWGGSDTDEKDLAMFKRFRPEEEYIDAMYEELALYWDAIIEEMPVLENYPATMRKHDLTPDDTEFTDHMLFWTIGQVMFTKIVRELLDRKQVNPEEPTRESSRDALKGLRDLEWRLHETPWKNFFLVKDSNKWKIRNEDRNPVMRITQRMQQWLIGIDELEEEGIKTLKEQWWEKLVPAQPEDMMNELWDKVEKLKL